LARCMMKTEPAAEMLILSTRKTWLAPRWRRSVVGIAVALILIGTGVIGSRLVQQAQLEAQARRYFAHGPVAFKILRPDSLKEYFIEDLVFFDLKDPHTLAILRHKPQPDLYTMHVDRIGSRQGYLVFEGKRDEDSVKVSFKDKEILIVVSNADQAVFAYETGRVASPEEIELFRRDPLYAPYLKKSTL